MLSKFYEYRNQISNRGTSSQNSVKVTCNYKVQQCYFDIYTKKSSLKAVLENNINVSLTEQYAIIYRTICASNKPATKKTNNE